MLIQKYRPAVSDVKFVSYNLFRTLRVIWRVYLPMV